MLNTVHTVLWSHFPNNCKTNCYGDKEIPVSYNKVVLKIENKLWHTLQNTTQVIMDFSRGNMCSE